MANPETSRDSGGTPMCRGRVGGERQPWQRHGFLRVSRSQPLRNRPAGGGAQHCLHLQWRLGLHMQLGKKKRWAKRHKQGRGDWFARAGSEVTYKMTMKMRTASGLPPPQTPKPVISPLKPPHANGKTTTTWTWISIASQFRQTRGSLDHASRVDRTQNVSIRVARGAADKIVKLSTRAIKKGRPQHSGASAKLQVAE